MLRKKVANKGGSEYKSLSPAQKKQVDDLVDKMAKKKVGPLAKKLMPVVYKAEKARYEAQKKRVQEAIDLSQDRQEWINSLMTTKYGYIEDPDKRARISRAIEAHRRKMIDSQYEETISEKITKDSKPKDVIDDFLDSDAPQFEGKSKKKIKMALAAYYDKQNEETIEERRDSMRKRSRHRAAAERNVHRRKKGSVEGKHRETSKSMRRQEVAAARELVAQQLGAQGDATDFTTAAMINTTGDRVKRTLIKHRKSGTITRRSGHRKRSSGSGTQIKKTMKTRIARLSADTEYDFEQILIEGDNEKFEQLFYRGLVEKDKIEIYKRIFDDVKSNIKYRRYQDDIAEMVDKLVSLITDDGAIYQRVRINLQKKGANI
jgi:hypothetical protein